MPRTLYDEDQQEVEVPTEDEIKEQTTKAVEEGTKTLEEGFRTEFAIPEGKDLKEYVKELGDSSNPNWNKAREKMDTLENVITQLKEGGKKLDEKGKIIEAEKTFTEDDIDKRVKDGVLSTTYDIEKSKLLSNYTEEEQKVVEDYLGRLMSGKDQSIPNLHGTFKEASKLAFPDKAVNPLTNAITSGGKPPAAVDSTKDLNADQKDLGSKFGVTDEDLEKDKEKHNK